MHGEERESDVWTAPSVNHSVNVSHWETVPEMTVLSAPFARLMGVGVYSTMWRLEGVGYMVP